jgi:uncharacterized DUF497 family protein
MIKYEWDEKKNQTNREKHGLCFEDAEYVFLGETVSFKDDREDYGEERFITMGQLESRVVILIHSQRYLVTRMISMRKANEREKKIYFQRLKETR